MSVVLRRILIWGSLFVLLAGGIAYALRPQPVPVDLARAEVKPLTVTIDEEGEARVRDVYTVYAPLSGYLLRISAEAGDAVAADKTELARIEPAPPAFLDLRSRAEQQAAIEAAKAARDLAAAELQRAEADLAYAAAERERTAKLIAKSAVSERAVDDAERAHRVAEANVATARAQLDMRNHELQQALSRLLPVPELARPEAGTCDCVPVTAPISGTVLRVLRRSAGIVEAGTPLLDIGDPDRLEVVADLLSEDAVRIRPGQKAIITGWGGPDLAARVRRIEPFGQTKVSALGIEEQRVDVVLDFAGPPAERESLGHGYRVETRIVLFQGDVLQVPLGALFRHEGGWAVFVAKDRTAQLRPVETGERTGLSVEIRSGLAKDETVVLYPGDRVAHGTSVVAR
ncbi:efflux RND transporter periplasmic adaptor subunit [Jiella sp. M17.18]|uniref:efflux RND transporter periplasmic adaptor subunit n=1 Tax=Jiella sp. M17.18 TaxID=3234247 RepID=UPI0034DF3B59